ncbi:MAG: Gfo/Idh/MocA family oxidoreductase [Ilumatobacteraceae bacterium]
MQHVKVGVVGVGGMGSFHARALAAFAGVEVAAVADVYRPNAIAASDATGAQIVDDPFALIADADIDAVLIASPDDTHADLTIAAIERGLFTLCEKPLATTVDDAHRVIAAEVAADRRLVQIGFMREFDPAHLQVLDELPAVGTIVAVRSWHRNANPSPRPVTLIVGQSLVHDVHSVRFITGAEIESVRASTAGIDDAIRHLTVICELSSGAHSTLEFDDCGYAYEVGVEVIGDHGDVVTGVPIRAVRRRAGSVDVHLGPDWFGWFADAYRRQDQAWINSVRDGRAAGPSTWDGFVSQTVVDAILRSIESGHTVTVPVHDRPGLYA